jgi:hypothetical protein
LSVEDQNLVEDLAPVAGELLYVVMIVVGHDLVSWFWVGGYARGRRLAVVDASGEG